MKKNLDITKPKQLQGTGPYFKVYNFKQKWLGDLIYSHAWQVFKERESYKTYNKLNYETDILKKIRKVQNLKSK